MADGAIWGAGLGGLGFCVRGAHGAGGRKRTRGRRETAGGRHGFVAVGGPPELGWTGSSRAIRSGLLGSREQPPPPPPPKKTRAHPRPSHDRRGEREKKRREGEKRETRDSRPCAWLLVKGEATRTVRVGCSRLATRDMGLGFRGRAKGLGTCAGLRGGEERGRHGLGALGDGSFDRRGLSTR